MQLMIQVLDYKSEQKYTCIKKEKQNKQKGIFIYHII